MDLSTVVELICTVGFPIFACIVLGWYVYQSDKLHKEELDKLSESVNNNTNTITKLIEMIKQVLNELQK